MGPSIARDLNRHRIGPLAEAIREAWSAETSVDERWHGERPSLGQCAVTALVIQDYLGGDLLRADVGGVSHYWNRLPGGAEIDLTRDQFTQFSPRQVETRSRDHVLSFPDTTKRYRLLRERIRARIAPPRSQASWG
jgi:hypothetical protein